MLERKPGTCECLGAPSCGSCINTRPTLASRLDDKETKCEQTYAPPDSQGRSVGRIRVVGDEFAGQVNLQISEQVRHAIHTPQLDVLPQVMEAHAEQRQA
jgi:hypothetical protein